DDRERRLQHVVQGSALADSYERAPLAVGRAQLTQVLYSPVEVSQVLFVVGEAVQRSERGGCSLLGIPPSQRLAGFDETRRLLGQAPFLRLFLPDLLLQCVMISGERRGPSQSVLLGLKQLSFVLTQLATAAPFGHSTSRRQDC